MDERTPPDTTAIQRLEVLRAAYADLAPRIRAGEPWPLSPDSGDAAESAWGPPELLAHLGEMLPFWLGEYERIVEAGRRPGSGVPFGRTSGDAMRQAILDRDRTVPLRELLGRIDAGIGRWQARLEEAHPGEGSAVGLHPRLGEMTAAGVVDHMVLGHLEEHRVQLEAILAVR